MPIFLERSLIDFRCVMVEHVYREKLVVRNGGRTAMKVRFGSEFMIMLQCSNMRQRPTTAWHW